MESKRIEELLEKYYNGATTLSEELELKAHFSNAPADSDAPETQLFGFLAGASQDDAGEGLDARIKTALTTRGSRTPVRLSYVRLAAAALVLLAVGAFYFLRQQRSCPAECKDPKVAYAQARRALLLVSEKMNLGGQNLHKIAKLDEMELLISKQHSK